MRDGTSQPYTETEISSRLCRGLVLQGNMLLKSPESALAAVQQANSNGAFAARSMSSVAKNNTGRETFAAVLMPIGARKYEEQLGGAEQSHGGLLLRNYC